MYKQREQSLHPAVFKPFVYPSISIYCKYMYLLSTLSSSVVNNWLFLVFIVMKRIPFSSNQILKFSDPTAERRRSKTIVPGIGAVQNCVGVGHQTVSLQWYRADTGKNYWLLDILSQFLECLERNVKSKYLTCR